MKLALVFLIFCGVSYANSGAGVNFFKVPGHNFGKSRSESQPTASRSSRPSFQPKSKLRFEPQSQFQSNTRPLGPSTSGKSDVDGTHGSSEYHYSWRHTGKHTKWDWGGAVNYCTKLTGGWEPISINDESENNFVSSVIGGEVDYIWTGGRRSGNGWKWPKGQFKNIAWSHTGGFRIPQPDNREGNEDCLSVLNNIYRDGIKWHDVACSHRKPIICERPARN